MNSPEPEAPRPPPWRLRFALVQLLQLPALGLAAWAQPPASWWLAAIWGSVVCCAGTDSGWRWRNRLLIVQATAWLVVALTFGV